MIERRISTILSDTGSACTSAAENIASEDAAEESLTDRPDDGVTQRLVFTESSRQNYDSPS